MEVLAGRPAELKYTCHCILTACQAKGFLQCILHWCTEAVALPLVGGSGSSIGEARMPRAPVLFISISATEGIHLGNVAILSLSVPSQRYFCALQLPERTISAPVDRSAFCSWHT